MMKTKTLLVADLRYKWQDSEPDMAIAYALEGNLRHGLFRKGLRAAGRAGMADLFEDIRANGVRDPMQVRDSGDGTYSIIRGNQRLSVARALHITELACEVYS